MMTKFRIGRVFWQGLSLTFKNLLPLSALACLFSLPYLYFLIDAVAEANSAAIAAEDVSMVSILVNIVFGALMQVVLINAVVMIAQGHPLKIVRCLRLGLFGSRSALITALVMVSVTQVAMSANVLLGVAVTILLLSLFFVAVPIAVVERSDPMTALGRSCALTAGSRLRIVFLGILFGIMLVIVGIVMALFDVEGAAAGLSVAGMFVAQVVAATLGAAISVLAYDEIRQIKEGHALDTVVAARIA